MADNFWRWKESSWRAEDKRWEEAEVITAGVDVGSVSSKAVVLGDGEILCYSSLRTGSDSPSSAIKALNAALDGTGLRLELLQFVVGTGYGRANVPFANKTMSEISCHARGANYIYGNDVRTILDMGGQDCKAIRCDLKGRVTAFAMNDKCAAGTGRSLEVMADLLKVPIEEIGPLSLTVEHPPQISSTCVVFAKTEALGLLHHGSTKAEVLAAYCNALAHRVTTMLRQVGVEREFVITGGIAKNVGVVRRVENELDVHALQGKLDPQIAGAVGAALFAQDLLVKSKP